MSEIGASHYALDVSCRSSYEAFVGYLGESNKIDVIVHNAGVTRDGIFKKMKFSKWNPVLDVNLFSIMELNKALLGVLSDDVRMICLSSIAGLAGNVGQTNYAASKAAISGYVRELNKSHRKYSVNAIAPGFIESDMTAKLPFFNKVLR